MKVLRTFLEKEKNTVMRKVKPKVRLFRKPLTDSQGLQISCLATGFYPRHVNLTLFRDGQPVDDEQITGGEILPNGDGTYQMRKSLLIGEKELHEDLEKSDFGSSALSIIIRVLVFFCVAVLIITALIIWRKRPAAGSHSLMVFATYITGPTQFPEFTLVLMLDDVQVMYYDSISMKAVHRSQSNSSDYSGVSIFSEIYDLMKFRISYLKDHQNCTDVKPKVRLFRKPLTDSQGLQISCLATGFYPRHINLTLFRDGQPVDDDQITGGEILPNGDGTYQMRKSLLIGEKELHEDLEKSDFGSSALSIIISALAFFCVAVLIITALIIWRKRRTAGVRVQQIIFGCELLNDDKPGLLQRWDAFNGQEILEYTFDTEKNDIQTKIIWEPWGQITRLHIKIMCENIYQPICIKALRRYLHIKKNSVMRKVKPRVRLMRKTITDSQDLQISCLATGFYPCHINLTLFRDVKPRVRLMRKMLPDSQGFQISCLATGFYPCHINLTLFRDGQPVNDDQEERFCPTETELTR
ncbi:major histocompatibility complex class I-related gene protein-like [Labeo rohita]|uniref:Major histocompatibility complex class I-related gene protein-like n=1 Tax=Labeo rohita TaxID=84645 RepID=A0A498P7A3_LABRO|nr:major histocompatibility complex class I-related gene protein-like [Labeo rohita]